MNVWKTPWHGPLFNSPRRESILLLKMRPFCRRLNHRSVTSHSHEHFSASGIGPRSPSVPFFFFFFFFEGEHNWLRIDLMFCRGHPVLWLTERVKPAAFPAAIPRTKVITVTSCSPWGASPWSAFYRWCHAAVCSNGSRKRAEAGPGSQTGRCEERRLRKDARWRLERGKTAEIKGKKGGHKLNIHCLL